MASRRPDRPWLPPGAARRVRSIVAASVAMDAYALATRLDELTEENRRIHDGECVNLNPASNVMNPRAEAMLSAGLSTRASLGYPGDKYEMGLEAIEQIEVIAADRAAALFGSAYAEVRLGSGALANLSAFMATCNPGDTIVTPPASIGGHVTHHAGGAAGLYGLRSFPAPVAPDSYSVDVDGLAALVARVRPRLITLGGSLNLVPHPVEAVREIADDVGATVLFDAAHLSGVIAGGAWPNPLAQGAHLMTMSTYKSFAGPVGGLVVTNDAVIAQRVESIVYPGLTANFDVGRTAALAVTLLDWEVAGAAYAAMMTATARALAEHLLAAGVPVFRAGGIATTSHQFALEARTYGGGQAVARRLREANLLASGIGLPIADVAGDLNGLRIGTPEAARIGMTVADMPALAGFIARALDDRELPAEVGREVSAWRSRFDRIHFTIDGAVARTAGPTHG